MSEISYMEKQELIKKSELQRLKQSKKELLKKFKLYPEEMKFAIEQYYNNEISFTETEITNLYNTAEIFG